MDSLEIEEDSESLVARAHPKARPGAPRRAFRWLLVASWRSRCSALVTGGRRLVSGGAPNRLDRASLCAAGPRAPWPAGAGDSDASGDSGSVLSAAALVAGTTVGAGVLALPAATAAAGFGLSSGVLLGAWAFMTTSALLVGESTVNAAHALRRPGVGLLATTELSLGSGVGRVAGACFAFIHYALLVAYIAQGGRILADGAGAPLVAGPLAFVAVFGGAVALGTAGFVEKLNNVLVCFVIASFVALVAVAAPQFDAQRLAQAGDARAAFAAVPVSCLALVFHNVVPVVAERLKGDLPALRTAVVAGSIVPLVMFLCWNGLVLGSVSDVSPGSDPVDALRNAADGSAMLGPIVSLFSEVAIATSFFGFFYGLRSFLCDLFAVSDGPTLRWTTDLGLSALVLGPPLLVAATKPDVFLGALDVAATFGVTTLFGIVPAATVWRQRYGDEAPAVEPLVPGGRATLAVMMAISSAVIIEGAADLVTR
ncbi:Tryptophan/tyrosine permease family-domain-containing protein [Pelagophyceae sp. CCMP2097]|nr:Tryptophan/tyrosine permease family-domain-containing protein [Pelagophyceae sp. CCMP2097]